MSNAILNKENLAASAWRYRIHSPKIARKRQAGQFIMLRPVPETERIPLTIANADAEQGWIEIIFQVVGRTTMFLSGLDVGDEISDIAGPLGHPTRIEKFGRVICIGGGIGVAPLYPILCSLKDAGNDVTTIIGARSKAHLILEKEMKEKSDKLFVATDDGSYGHHGFVSDVFNQVQDAGDCFDSAFVIGPVMMMKVVSSLTLASGINTVVSLNPIMIDGTGMCGGCRVTVHGKTKFACVDGPEFDASGIDWEELIRRLKSYQSFEEKERNEHQCALVQ